MNADAPNTGTRGAARNDIGSDIEVGWQPWLGRTRRLLESELASSPGIGAQVYAWQDGAVLADFALGSARPEVDMEVDTPVHWFCCTKPLIATAVAQLVDAGKIQVSDRVCDHIPPFAVGGKSQITVEHLLTHTSGVRHFAHPRPFVDKFEDIIAAVCASDIELGWTPGRRAAYQPFTTWYILGEIVQRASGVCLSEYVNNNVLRLPSMAGCSLGINSTADLLASTVAVPQLVSPTKPSLPLNLMTIRHTLEICNPASGAIGPVRGLGELLRALMVPGAGERLISEDMARLFLSARREGIHDEATGLYWKWGLGFAVDLPYLCPSIVGPGFGHMGGSVLAIADRARNRIVAVALNIVFSGSDIPTVGPSTLACRTLAAIYHDLDHPEPVGPASHR